MATLSTPIKGLFNWAQRGTAPALAGLVQPTKSPIEEIKELLQMQQGQNMPQQSPMLEAAKIKFLERASKPQHVDTQGEYNRSSQLPSSAAGAGANPWNSGLFKGLPENTRDDYGRPKGGIESVMPGYTAMTPQQRGAAFAAMGPSDNPRGETIQAPNPWASSFMPNSGDDFGADGYVQGRSAANRFGSGSTSFPQDQVPQPPTDQRFLINDPNFIGQNSMEEAVKQATLRRKMQTQNPFGY